MRDPKRIQVALDLLKEYWSQAPDLRLAQIIGNFWPHGGDPYNMEDDLLIAKLRAELQITPPVVIPEEPVIAEGGWTCPPGYGHPKCRCGLTFYGSKPQRLSPLGRHVDGGLCEWCIEESKPKSPQS